ncbi:lysozyme inhibitor LprI family protein [Azospirillum sp. sgz302134]
MAVTLAVLAGSPAARAASFDCTKAKTPDEILICADPDLSRADERMAAAYKSLMEAVQAQGLDAGVRDRLRGQQRAWVTLRNSRCDLKSSTKIGPDNRATLVDCMRWSVLARIDDLELVRDGLPITALAEPKRIAETNKAKHYQIDASYPVLPASIAGADAFNPLAERQVRTVVNQFLKETVSDDVPEPDMMSTLDIGYRITLATPRLMSVQFDFYEYGAGAAHGTGTASALHVDLQRRKALTAADVFAAGSGWEKAVAAHAMADLKRQAKADDFELDEGAGENVAALVPDLVHWRLEPDRAVIVFNAYEVAAYAVGPREVAVPYALLTPYFKPDSPLPPKRS